MVLPERISAWRPESTKASKFSLALLVQYSL